MKFCVMHYTTFLNAPFNVVIRDTPQDRQETCLGAGYVALTFGSLFCWLYVNLGSI
jgi:hypothetical protein